MTVISGCKRKKVGGGMKAGLVGGLKESRASWRAEGKQG